MRVEAVGATMYPMPVQSVKSVSPVKRENIIESYSKIAESEIRNGERARFDTFERVEEKPDFKAVNLIKKSEIPPPEPPTADELLARRIELAPKIEIEPRTDITEIRGELSEQSGVSVQRREEVRSERIEQTATANSAEEIAAASVGTKLTPSQQKGIEVYQRIQRYSDPLSISNVQMAG